MTDASLIEDAQALFRDAFGADAAVATYAPGRVNLLGEHTDYNGGLVLPMPLSLGTAVAFGRGGAPGTLEAASASFKGTHTRGLKEAPADHWTDYVLGSLREVDGTGNGTAGLRIAVAANLPAGAGLSSSAALEVATIRAAAALLGQDLDPVDVAQRARRAENSYVGMPCGIMDQFAVSVGTPGNALFLDTRRLEHRAVPLPAEASIVIVHSGVAHKLTDDGYATRVAECNAACQALGVNMLSDLGPEDTDRINALAAPLDGRARHIVTENDRVQRAVQALADGKAGEFARLMVESHASQRDDYAVSVPEVDELVAGALELGAQGARLTGGGFGGSIVALVANDRVPSFCRDLPERFSQARVLAVSGGGSAVPPA